jgi:HlyD family secretion protein
MKRLRFAVVFAVLAIIAVLVWRFGFYSPAESPNEILSSGFIEAREVSISLESGGRIVDIIADEGEKVEADIPLVRLDDSLLQAQKQRAEVNLQLAQAQLVKAMVSQNGTKKLWENALEVQNNPLELEARITIAQGELDLAELTLERALTSEPQWSFWERETAQLRRDIAKEALDSLLGIRDNSQEINALVDQAYNNYQTAVAAVKVAEIQVEQAAASLGIIEVQIEKLTAISPMSGVVAARYAEVGEMAQPGVPVLNIIELEEVTLTAYIPESKIGLVKLGQEALISVDSYPEENFSGEVTYISPKALFTPRNVQLKEEREKMVFAVKIRLANPEEKLKPGMPADVKILANSGG